MALIVVNEGEAEFLTRMMKYEGSKLKLYTSNTTWGEASTIGSCIECSTGGYAQIALATSWTITTPAGGTTYATYAEQTFTFTSACTAYGYILTNSAASILLIAEAFTDGPYTIPSGGGTIKITPRIEAN